MNTRNTFPLQSQMLSNPMALDPAIPSINRIPNPTPPLLPRNLPNPHLPTQIRPLHMRAAARINIHLPDPHHPQLILPFPSLSTNIAPIPPLRNQPLQPLPLEIPLPPERYLHRLSTRHNLIDSRLNRRFEVPAYEALELARGAAGVMRGFELVEIRDRGGYGGADGAAEDVAGGV